MIHFSLPASGTRAAAAAPDVLPPISPAHYLRLRRKAAGLTIAQVADRLGNPLDRDHARALLALLETEGSAARHRLTLDGLRAVFPFDPDVYVQLRDDDPATHPRICRGCGCSEWDPCVRADEAEHCAWVSRASCSVCADRDALSRAGHR
ncbi:hypothetical protein [Sphingomonas oligophenolica]|uniref:HTH cro/C1-type domain-containing protein n=1 Tax=Sphingomonas oligophenolica TaxID=301154 RepID=A0A502CRF7_9SPHN|nr:hypothetical protein [Sphingomonas oligophenolica]TPG14386.1 hypothetical protein EAH84_03500 [Sphingomonas oligophenolica]